MRVKIIRLIIFLLLIIVGLDLVYLQIIRGPYFYSLSVNNRIRVIPLEGLRGVITDRNGVVLADNRLAFDVSVIPQDVKDRDKLFGYLGDLLRTDRDVLERRFWERKVTPFAPVVIAGDVDKQMAMKLEENKFLFPGLYIQENFRRRYLYKNVGAHVLGYLGKIDRSRIEKLKDYGYTYQSVIGYSGVEEYYDAFLRGKEGGQQIEVDSRGQQVRLLGTREAENGQDIRLTIDQRIQQAAVETLEERLGSIIVMDLESGEILGMVSSPSYDPNIFIDSQLKKQAKKIFTDSASPLLNRAIMGQYPPGSVYKVIEAIAGLVVGKVSPDTTFFCPGYYRLGRRHFRCTHQHGTQNLVEGIAHSCNVYFYNVGLLLGPDILTKYARLFGLGTITHVDLPAEEKGLVPGRALKRKRADQGWYKGDTMNFSIGQGDFLVTPLQLVRMMATVARKGREVQPHLIRSIGEKEIIKMSTVRNLNVPEGVFDIVHKGLRGAVEGEGGTARVLNIPDWTILGKTGTAQSVPGREEHSWFVGYSKNRTKDIVFCVFLEYGGSSYRACVLAKEFLKRLDKEGVL